MYYQSYNAQDTVNDVLLVTFDTMNFFTSPYKFF